MHGFPNVTLRADDSDAVTLLEFKRAVKTRREARARAAASEAFDAQSRIAALKGSMTSRVLRDHMKSGRGVAALHVVQGGGR